MSIANEDRLIIQCSRVELSRDADAAVSRLISLGLNWDYILESSIRHAVAPLLYHGLKQTSRSVDLAEMIPASVIEALSRLYRRNGSRNQRLFGVLGDVVRSFHGAGVRVLGLKDVALAREIYPHIAMRPMGDIDLLIDRSDYVKAAKCMEDLGFIPLPSRQIPYTLKYAWSHAFRRPADNVWIDLQWNVLQRNWDTYDDSAPVYDIDQMWRQARLIQIDDYSILVPSLEDMLFHLCLHLEGHGYCELVLFCDIAELLKSCRDEIDWDEVCRCIRTYKAESAFYYVLLFTQRLFDVAVPSSVLATLQPLYFSANLYKPLFGNLTALHLSLDDIRLAASPPAEVMNGFELVARRQALAAIRSYEVIDDIARTFIGLGGSVAIAQGSPSETIIPDRSLRPFEELLLYILDQDLALMRQVLERCQFQIRYSQHIDTYIRTLALRSNDPALVDHPPHIALQIEIQRDTPVGSWPGPTANGSKKAVAMRVLKGKLARVKQNEATIPLIARIIPLRPEDMVLSLAARLGKEDQSRLFGICSIVEFFRRYHGPIDWQQIASSAEHHGIATCVSQGLSMVEEFLEDHRLPPRPPSLAVHLGSEPRLLEWARYGSDSLIRYTRFKKTYFYLLTLLSIDGVHAKCRYLLRSLFGHRDSKPILPSLTIDLLKALFALLRPKTLTTRDLAYWVEADQPPAALSKPKERL